MTPLLAQQPRADRSFERLYRRHAGDVYRYAFAILRNAADAEDVTQTTFLNAYRAIQGGQRPESPRSWLVAIAHNVCRQRFRQSSRRPLEVLLDDDVAHDAPDVERFGLEDARRALGHLPFNQRSALVMRELEGRSYAEIADQLELTNAAVETLVFRARRAVREHLDGALTCAEAERAVSRQLDGRLPRRDKGRLRAHLRECKPCASAARSMRAQRVAIRSLGAVPLPASLTSFLGGGAATGAGAAFAAKAAAVVVAGVVTGGTAYGVVRETPSQPAPQPPAVAAAPAGPSAARVLPKPHGPRPHAARPHGHRAIVDAPESALPKKAQKHAKGPKAGHGHAFGHVPSRPAAGANGPKQKLKK